MKKNIRAICPPPSTRRWSCWRRADYVADRSLATVLFLALKMGRPLFLEGEAGVGKTEIAKVLASTLGRRLIRLQCYEGLDVVLRRLRVELCRADDRDPPGRSARAPATATRLEHDIFSERFLIKRPLLQALEPDPAGAPVLLIDELDRTDEAFEAFLLEVLSDFQVTIPGTRHDQGRAAADRHHHLQPHARNPRRAEAALPLSLGRLSRCRARTRRSCARKVPGVAEKLSREIVHFVQKLRAEDLFKSPGVAETLDWATALTELDEVALDPATVSDTLGVLLKYQDDIARIDGGKVQGHPRTRCARTCAPRSRRWPHASEEQRPPRRQHRLFRARAARGGHAARARAR